MNKNEIKKEENKRGNKKISIVSVMLIAILFLLIGVSISKYTYHFKGNGGSMDVAKWNVSVNNGSITRENYSATTVAIDKLAPGTAGSFDIVVDAKDTEVGVKYTVSFGEITNKPANLYFMVEDTKYASLDEVATALSGTIDANATSKSKTLTVKWAWDYETTTSVDGTRTTVAENDIQDTLDGSAAKTMSFNIDVLLEQVQPTK